VGWWFRHSQLTRYGSVNNLLINYS
jgi:hypothetical protein